MGVQESEECGWVAGDEEGGGGCEEGQGGAVCEDGGGCGGVFGGEGGGGGEEGGGVEWRVLGALVVGVLVGMLVMWILLRPGELAEAVAGLRAAEVEGLMSRRIWEVVPFVK